MVLRDSRTSWNELGAERGNKITSHEFSTANSITSLQAFSHLQWAHFVKLTQVEKINIFLFSTQSHSDKLNYQSWGQQVKNHLDSFSIFAFETT